MWIILTVLALLSAAVCGVCLYRVQRYKRRLDELAGALAAWEPAVADYPRIANEVRDMRETLESLPLDDLQGAADADALLMKGMENIVNYSQTRAMGRGESG